MEPKKCSQPFFISSRKEITKNGTKFKQSQDCLPSWFFFHLTDRPNHQNLIPGNRIAMAVGWALP